MGGGELVEDGVGPGIPDSPGATAIEGHRPCHSRLFHVTARPVLGGLHDEYDRERVAA
jgi:hypothetical protein